MRLPITVWDAKCLGLSKLDSFRRYSYAQSLLAIVCLWFAMTASTQAATLSLSATNLVEGPAAGTDQVTLQTSSPTDPWTATANADWLHVDTASGTGSSTVIFGFDANTGPERNAILTIAGLTMKVLQRATNWNGTPVTTLAATGVGMGKATFHSAVNPSAGAADAFFEYSTNGGWLVSTIVDAGIDYCSSREYLLKDNNGTYYVTKPDCNRMERIEMVETNGTVVPRLTVMSHPYYWHGPSSMILATNGDIYVGTDWCIYKYIPSTDSWSVWAGDPSITQQTVDGIGTAARFRSILGMTSDGAGNFYVGCMYNIRKVVESNIQVTSLTDQGTSADNPRDGPCKSSDPNLVAIINGATGMATDDFGNLYWTERGMLNQHYIRKLPLSGSCMITTVAGAGTTGYADGVGSAAKFRWPCNMVADKGGNLYVGDQNALRKVTPDGIVTTLVLRDAITGEDSTFQFRLALTQDSEGNLMVIHANKGSIQRIKYDLAAPVAAVTAQSGLTGTSTVPFEKTVMGLRSGTTYFFRTVVTNSLGTNYGEILSFTTPPTVLTTTNLVEGPAAGTGNLVLGVDPDATWTATAHSDWLHVTTPSGTGSANVRFTFDANPGSTRVGTMTVGNDTVTVTQAGSTYTAARPVTLFSTGLSPQTSTAVDRSGNVYVSEASNNVIYKWNVADGSISTLVSSGLNAPNGVAVDRSGNVYIADTGNQAIKKWTAATGQLSTLVSSGLSSPYGIALDHAGNVYIADTGLDTIQKWNVADSAVTTVVSSGLGDPNGIAVDAAGDLYISDTGDSTIKKWSAANGTLSALVTSGLNRPAGVAVDGSGNVYIADPLNSAVKEWNAISGLVTSLVSGLSAPAGVAVDGWGNVYIATTGNQTIQELPRAFVDCSAKTAPPFASVDSLPAVVPVIQNLSGPFAPTSDQSWLTPTGSISSIVSFSFTDNPGSPRTAHINLMGQSIAVTQDAISLNLTHLVEGPTIGTNSVLLAVGAGTAWTATANCDWLHVTTPSGTGSANVQFSFDANSGDTRRTGTLTIAGQTLTVTQAGVKYSAVNSSITLVSSLSNPLGVAVDGSGNVYIADTGNHAIKKWNVTDHTVSTLVTEGLSNPSGVAVDNFGNVYIADTGNHAIKRWDAASHIVSSLVSTGLSSPFAVAVDNWGNVYINDRGNYAIKKCDAASGIVTVLISEFLADRRGIALDGAGNVYIADDISDKIVKWIRASNTQSSIKPADPIRYSLHHTSVYFQNPWGVAVDGSGHIYAADGCILNTNLYDPTYNFGRIVKRDVNSGDWTTVLTDVKKPYGVAVDGRGSLYFTDGILGEVKKLTRAFVDCTARTRPPFAGNDKLPAVVPATQDLSGPFAPTSDQSWLTITGVADGVVSYSLAANTGAERTAHITLLGGSITITQAGPTLGTSTLVEGTAAGADSVILAVEPSVAWTATANATWLHVTTGSGAGSSKVYFSFDANTGATRTGTLTIAGLTLTVIQAGATYSAANPLAALASLSGSSPFGLAVDATGNVYIADQANSAILRWKVADGNKSTLVSSGLNHPSAVAVDGEGNVYIADTGNNAIKRWNLVGGEVTAVVSTGLNAPSGVAVDGWGNVYIADRGNHAVKRWNRYTGTVTTLVSSGLDSPCVLALDVAGDLYIADSGNNTIKKWEAVSGAVTTLVQTGLSHPNGVAVDGSGNVFIADTGNQAIKKWNAADGTVMSVVASGLSSPVGVAVDKWGNVYIADTSNPAILEVPRAFVDATAKTEPSYAGSDTLPVVAPVTQNLAWLWTPTPDQEWLTVTGVTNGVARFSFTQNSTISSRTANLTLLGRNISVTQGYAFTLSVGNLVEGPSAGGDSVIVTAVSPQVVWTVTPNASWLHATTASGTGSGIASFTFDANTGPTRTGALTIGAQTVSVVQAGSSYAAANSYAKLVSAGLSGPRGVALDSAGQVYIADFSSSVNNDIKKWNPVGNVMISLVVRGSVQPWGVAPDAAGNVYFSEGNTIKRWNASDSSVTVPVSSGLNSPRGLAIDRWGSIYIADYYNKAIKKLNPTNNTVTQVFAGLSGPHGVAVDLIGNLYVADGADVKKWNIATSTLSTLVSGLTSAYGVAVDTSGNIYTADNTIAVTANGPRYSSVLMKWNAGDNTVTTLLTSDLNTVYGLAVDGSGNLYVGNTAQVGSSSLQKLPRAFVDTAPRIEPATSGTEALPVVLPSTQNLSGPFTPTSDQPWLSIAGVADGVVSFDFSLNTGGRTRTGHIGVLGHSIAIHQSASPFYAVGLSMTHRVEGPAGGTDSVVLAIPASSSWTATANAAWLHLPNESGTGPGNVFFSFDANPGATRTGTLTIAGQTLTVTQAGSPYVTANLLTNLVGSQLNLPAGVAVDGSGNVYIADTANHALKRWRVTDGIGIVSTLVSSGLNAPSGVAVDALANVYIADTGNNEVKRWNAFDGSMTVLVGSGLNAPRGVAVDGYGNVYIADTGNRAIRKWNAADGAVTALVSSGLSDPSGVAVDFVGNVYIADSGNGTVKRWDHISGAVTEVCSGFSQPGGVAVDDSGNVYIADTGHDAIQKWSAADNTVIPLVSSQLSAPGGVAVDGSGSVYIADTDNNSIKELPRAFLDVTSKTVPTYAGTGALPVVLPSTQHLTGPLAPASDEPWLTILGATNGVVSFYRTAVSGYGRTAHISLLGRTITVTQAAAALGAASLVVGPAAGSDSVVLAAPPENVWTVAANADWLHVTTASGAGDTNVVFSFDANTGLTRTGTLTIAGQTLTVIQAGATYTPASAAVSLGVSTLRRFGVDSSGNVYYSDSTSTSSIKKWNVTNSTVVILGSDSSVSTEVRIVVTPAADDAGNVYFTDIASMGPSLFRKWEAASGAVSTLGTNTSSGLAVAASGDVYIAEGAIKKWDRLSGVISTVVTTNLNSFSGVAVDIAGNVYTADQPADAIKKWNAASSNLTTLIPSALNAPYSVDVDGSGNVWLLGTNSLKKWKAADNTLTTMVAATFGAFSTVGVDGTGNAYFTDNYRNMKVLPHAFVDKTAKIEPASAGNDTLAAVVPSTQNLSGPFTPTSDQPWLTITGATNGVVSYSLSANTGPDRIAHITLLGEVISVTQAAPKTTTTLMLASSLNPASYSASITFTSTVSPVEASGTVTFKDGSTTLGAATLTGGIATFTTNSLNVGSHNIRAEYSGDSLHHPSTNIVTQMILSLIASNAVCTRAKDLPLKIRIADIAGDVNGNPITVQSLGASVQGAILSYNSTFIFYQPAANENDSFAYTVSNGIETAAGTITVNVISAPSGTIKAIVVSSGTASIVFYGIPGIEYDVQRTTNLAEPITWTTLTSSPLIPSADGSISFIDTNAPNGAAFYRSIQH